MSEFNSLTDYMLNISVPPLRPLCLCGKKKIASHGPETSPQT